MPKRFFPKVPEGFTRTLAGGLSAAIPPDSSVFFLLRPRGVAERRAVRRAHFPTRGLRGSLPGSARILAIISGGIADAQPPATVCEPSGFSGIASPAMRPPLALAGKRWPEGREGGRMRGLWIRRRRSPMRRICQFSIAVAALLFGASVFAADAPPHDTPLDALIAQYKDAPTSKIRTEMLNKAALSPIHLSMRCCYLKPPCNERGWYHIESFVLPLPKAVIERLNNAESIAALNCFVRECCVCYGIPGAATRFYIPRDGDRLRDREQGERGSVVRRWRTRLFLGAANRMASSAIRPNYERQTFYFSGR